MFKASKMLQQSQHSRQPLVLLPQGYALSVLRTEWVQNRQTESMTGAHKPLREETFEQFCFNFPPSSSSADGPRDMSLAKLCFCVISLMRKETKETKRNREKACETKQDT